MTTITEKPAVQPTLGPATEPPKRWRNWWRNGPAASAFRCNICGSRGHTYGPHEVFRNHCRVFPSKDAAETRAAEQMQQWRSCADYLGAFPEEERP